MTHLDTLTYKGYRATATVVGSNEGDRLEVDHLIFTSARTPLSILVGDSVDSRNLRLGPSICDRYRCGVVAAVVAHIGSPCLSLGATRSLRAVGGHCGSQRCASRRAVVRRCECRRNNVGWVATPILVVGCCCSNRRRRVVNRTECLVGRCRATVAVLERETYHILVARTIAGNCCIVACAADSAGRAIDHHAPVVVLIVSNSTSRSRRDGIVLTRRKRTTVCWCAKRNRHLIAIRYHYRLLTLAVCGITHKHCVCSRSQMIPCI